MKDTMEAIAAAAPGVAVGLVLDRDMTFRHLASKAVPMPLAYHRAKMVARFAGTVEPNLEEQRWDKACRKVKNPALHRMKV